MQHQSLFVFDIETVPDTDTAKVLLDDNESNDKDLRQKLADYHLKITDGRSSFLRQPFHKVVAISFLEADIIRDHNGTEKYELTSLRTGGEEDSSEEDLIKGLFSHLNKKKPRFVSYNGRNFDLPVLKYRAMKHEISAPWLYKTGDKWNNYNQRYSLDWHCDLAEAFSDFGASSRTKMNEVCACANLPGKTGIDGSMVADFFDEGKIGKIRDYCETDVANTYLLYLVYQHHTGTISTDNFLQARLDLSALLEKDGAKKPHLKEFLDEWKGMDNRF